MKQNNPYQKLLDIITEWMNEEEDHMPKKSPVSKNFGKVDNGKVFSGKTATVPQGEKIQSFTDALRSSQKGSDFISSVNKERMVSLLWEAYEANLESLKVLVGEDTRIKIAKERVSSCIEDWRLKNE